MLKYWADEFSELSAKQAIELIKEHFAAGVTGEESWGKGMTAKRVEIFWWYMLADWR